MSRHPLYLVDAFTRTPFRGNPAAVCLLRADLPEPSLRSIAAEMNLPETAFLRAPDGDLFASDRFELRWFTPTREVPLCGHATLASAKVLFDELGLAAETIRFDSKSGPLSASRRDHAIELDFPRSEPTPAEVPRILPGLLRATTIEEAARSEERGVLLARLPSPDDVRSLAPDFPRLAHDLPGVRMVVATARGAPPYDFVSRCFAPADGIDEDPVTGMAHTVLAPYWAPILTKTRFHALQASARGGELEVELLPTGRVALRGEARIVLRGYLDVPG